MASPSVAITRLELSQSFAEFDLAASRRGFIGPLVLRPRLVGAQAADIGKIPLEQLLQNHATIRAPKAGYARGDFTFEKFSYATEDHGWEEPIDDRQSRAFRDILDAEAVHSQRAIDFVLRQYEIDAAAAIYDTATWTGEALTTELTNEWDDVTNADPIADIEAARLLIVAGCGVDPNALVINRRQFIGLRNAAKLVDRVKYSGKVDPTNITAGDLAKTFGLDFVFVAGGYQNTADVGQTASISAIWSDEYAML